MIEKLIFQEGKSFPYIDDTGCSYETKTDYLREVLNFCGCGNPEEVLKYIRDMLLTLDSAHWGENKEISYKFFLYWADSIELSEHGSSINCSWLTSKGKELLNDINWCIENEKEEFE